MSCGIILAIALTVEPGGLTMESALEKIRVARADGDSAVATVTVKGINRIVRPVVFTAADHDVDFIGEEGATISGGIRLGGWKDVGDGVWECDAPKTAKAETAFFDQLWVNGRRANCARLPSEGWLDITAASQTVSTVSASKYVESVTFADARVKALAAAPPEDYPYLEVGIICKWSYGLRTLDAYDAERNEILLRTDFPWKSWKRWAGDSTLVAFFNVRSAFDAPGEWFLDMKAGKVRYRPLPDEDVTAAEIVAPNPDVPTLLCLKGGWDRGEFVRNIRFRGIAFEHAAAKADGNRPHPIDQLQAASTMEGAVSLTGVRGISFEDCRIAHCAGYGMRFHSGCMSNRVVSCRIADPGAGGIWMGADFWWWETQKEISRQILKPDRKDAVAFNVVSNCVISGGGRYNPEGVGVCLSHCSDTAVVHNDIFDFYYSGISVGWTWGFTGSVSQRNDIGFNRIWDLGKGVMSDMGGVYTLGTSFGTKVHDNVIHDVKSCSYGGWGLYCDEGSEGIVEERNLVWNTTDGGFHQHYGAGCVIRNNIFAFNKMLGAVRMYRDIVQNVPCTLNFVNNIVYVDEGPLAGEGVRNVGGVWANNLWYDARGKDKAQFDKLDWDAWVASGKETGSAYGDPLFADPQHFDFTLSAESPALKLGFKPFDLSRSGSSLTSSEEGARVGLKASEPRTRLWNMDELSKAPSVRPVDDMSGDGVRAIMIDGPAWKGKRTSAFAYYALPDGASATNKVPGIVLVHGGLGTAYKRWVKVWQSRGYAAIAVDNCGGWPVKGEGRDWLRHRLSGPPGWGGFDAVDQPQTDQWFYHAVALSILSHSYLRSLPEVDSRAIGITGISWGGILTCVIAAVDTRLAYAVPVYGCGFLGDHSFLLEKHRGPVAERWTALWDPSHFLPLVKCPFLWVDGTNDFAFPLDSVRKSADLVKDSAFTTIVRMVHSHGAPGEDPAEILAFADHYARGGRDIVRIVESKTENGTLSVRFDPKGRAVTGATLVWTAESVANWKDRRYESKKVADFDPQTCRVSAEIPKDARLWYLSLTTDDGLRFCSPVEGPALEEYP